MLPSMRARPALLALTAVLAPCGCDEPSEEVLLQRRLDSVEVGLYRAGRDTIAQTAADPRAGKSRDALVKLFAASPDGGTGDHLANARSVLDAIGSDPPPRRPEESPPLLPGLVGLVRPGATLDPRLGRDEERVVLGGVLWVLHAHPDAPHVPGANSFALYEAMAITKAGLAGSALRRPARALRALTLGQARLCDMAEQENQALRQGAPDEALGEGLSLLGLADATPAQVRALGLSLRALAAAQVAECFVDRRDVERAAPALAALCEEARALGLDGRELGDVCRGKPDTAAIARATRTLLLHRSGLEERLRALPVVEAARRFVTGTAATSP
jgi:hypothetical protein